MRTPPERRLLVAQLQRLIDSAVLADRYDTARHLGEQAMAMARLADDSGVVRQVVAHLAEVRETEAAWQDARRSMAVLAQTPGDPAASLKVGRFLCFVKGDWQAGLPILARQQRHPQGDG